MKRMFMCLGIASSLAGGACTSTPTPPKPDPVFPPAQRHTYVIESLEIPTSAEQARLDGFDLNGDGIVDNGLGEALGTLAANGIDVITPVTASIDRGTSTTLAELQTANFTNTDSAAFTTYVGGASVPPACVDVGDTTCRRQFSGDAEFALAPAGSSYEPPLLGAIAQGTFDGGPRPLALQLALSTDTPFVLSLIEARVQLSDLSADGVGHAIIAGGVTTADVNTKVVPAAATQMNASIATICVAQPSGTDCGCPTDSESSGLLREFDNDHNCRISVDELLNSSLFQTLIVPDLFFDADGNSVDPTTDGAIPALSVGFAATLVAARFTPPAP